MISQDHVIKGSFDFMAQNSSWQLIICDFIDREALKQVNTLPRLVVIGTVVLEKYWFLLVTLFSKTTRSKGHMWLYGQEPLKLSHHTAEFGDERYHGSGDIVILVWDVVLQYHAIKRSCDFMSRSPSI